ncbi:hypothetical protein [Croceimicrobium sp.]|uniref:hypothetical protein n=1 Tax=Croceimicrobium sp. TaxID=2828340 RepID=UPI003BAB131F
MKTFFLSLFLCSLLFQSAKGQLLDSSHHRLSLRPLSSYSPKFPDVTNQFTYGGISISAFAPFKNANTGFNIQFSLDVGNISMEEAGTIDLFWSTSNYSISATGNFFTPSVYAGLCSLIPLNKNWTLSCSANLGASMGIVLLDSYVTVNNVTDYSSSIEELLSIGNLFELGLVHSSKAKSGYEIGISFTLPWIIESYSEPNTYYSYGLYYSYLFF